MSEVFRRTRVVQSEDIDALGHVNNVRWLQFVVELADAHSSSRGLDWRAYQKIGGMWIVRRHEIDYARSAVPGDAIDESTWIASMRGARCLRRARFTRGGDLLVDARTDWAFVDTKTQRPKRIAPEVLSRFTPMGEDAPPD